MTFAHAHSVQKSKLYTVYTGIPRIVPAGTVHRLSKDGCKDDDAGTISAVHEGVG